MTNLRPMPPEDVTACFEKVAALQSRVAWLKGLPRSPENDPVILAGLKEIERIMQEICGLLEGREWIN